ncbi:FAD-dependent oxidoreductase [Clostridium sp. AWRP]|uniref:oxidoreductase n=1 Tax=Clostridium sp. AWRP TaxID=2212991 RepID=UPI000FDB29BA|nr:FAD-dependent oxidoreductase [Clostridium sp. AWRP]AZV58058.1 NADH:flavin oxidoreductase [Clostridium sp. AWRP]
MNITKYPHVFQPLKFGNTTLKNRLEFTPMVSCLSNAEGEVTEEAVEFIGMQARSGVSQVIIGDTQVDWERAVCFYGELNVHHDKYMTGLSLLVEEAHRYGAKLSIELAHAGRGGVPSMNVKPGFAPSYLPTPGRMQDLKVMDRADMDYVINQFKDCASRVKRAGFDAIFIHSGHNNLLGQFLSRSSNLRTDEYGGSMENRMRFPLEIIKGIREVVGSDFPLEMRVSGDEMTGPDGIHIEETIAYLKEAQKYINMAHISCGNVFVEPGVKYSVPLYLQERMQNVKYAEAVKKAVDIPVSVVGNIFTLEEAEEIIASGKADVVGMCRSLMADPDLIKKSVNGESEDIRPCLRCMDGCGKIFNGFPVRCAVNPVVGREFKYKDIQPAKIKKKVMVIGGGPAGMQATQTLIKRGHDVTLYEKSDQLGGLLLDAGAVSFKNLMRDYTKWNVDTTMKSGAKIRLNTEVTKELVEQDKPDAVIIATGSTYIRPNIKGIDKENVKMLRDVENGNVNIGKNVIICGGGLSGIEGAVGLAREGKEVTVIDMIPAEKFCESMFGITRKALFDEVEESKVKLVGSSKIIEFLDNGVVIEDQEGNRKIMEADSIVIALGLKSQNKLAEEIMPILPVDTYIVGDADKVGTVRKANKNAFDIAVEI